MSFWDRLAGISKEEKADLYAAPVRLVSFPDGIAPDNDEFITTRAFDAPEHFNGDMKYMRSYYAAVRKDYLDTSYDVRLYSYDIRSDLSDINYETVESIELKNWADAVVETLHGYETQMMKNGYRPVAGHRGNYHQFAARHGLYLTSDGRVDKLHQQRPPVESAMISKQSLRTIFDGASRKVDSWAKLEDYFLKDIEKKFNLEDDKQSKTYLNKYFINTLRSLIRKTDDDSWQSAISRLKLQKRFTNINEYDDLIVAIVSVFSDRNLANYLHDAILLTHALHETNEAFWQALSSPQRNIELKRVRDMSIANCELAKEKLGMPPHVVEGFQDLITGPLDPVHPKFIFEKILDEHDRYFESLISDKVQNKKNQR